MTTEYQAEKMECLKGWGMMHLLKMALELLHLVEKMAVWFAQLEDLSLVHQVEILVDLKDVASLYLVLELGVMGLQDLEQMTGRLILLKTEDLMLQMVDLKVAIMEHQVVRMVHLVEGMASYQMVLRIEIVALLDELLVAQTLVLAQVCAKGSDLMQEPQLKPVLQAVALVMVNWSGMVPESLVIHLWPDHYHHLD